MPGKLDLRLKVEKELPEFASEVASLSSEDINARLAGLAKADDANDEAKENDEEYQAAKQLVSEMSAPYRDSAKVIKMKSKYLIMLLKERGTNE